MIFKTESNFHGIFRLTSKFLPHYLAASKMDAEGNHPVEAVALRGFTFISNALVLSSIPRGIQEEYHSIIVF